MTDSNVQIAAKLQNGLHALRLKYSGQPFQGDDIAAAQETLAYICTRMPEDDEIYAMVERAYGTITNYRIVIPTGRLEMLTPELEAVTQRVGQSNDSTPYVDELDEYVAHLLAALYVEFAH